MGKLFQDSGGSRTDRAEEAIKILAMIQTLDYSMLSDNDKDFLGKIREKLSTYSSNALISPKEIFYLRDIKDKVMDGPNEPYDPAEDMNG
jgi:hypothetical protein